MKLVKLFLSAMCAVMISVSAFAQANVATGTVNGDDGQPLIGASIIVKGTSNGTITNADGTFSLSNVDKGATLVVESLGYQPLETVFNGKALEVTLKTDAELLDQAVVVGYGIQKKSDITGSISSVKSDALENRSVVDVASSIQGKVAGVEVLQTTGMPGTFGQIRVRGLSSNDESSSLPLYVVDGVIVASLDNYDPEDIESIEILKDGASAAIYGAQAGNGVVLVTTKKGSKANGHGTISYDGSYTFEMAGQTPKMLNAEQYIEAMTSANVISQQVIDQLWDGKTDTDWIKELYSGGGTQRHKLSFSGANDRGSLYLAVSYLDSDGMMMSDMDYYKRFNVQANAEYKIKDWLTVGTNNTFSQTDKAVFWNIGGLSAGSSKAGKSFYRLATYDPLTPTFYNSYDEMPQEFKTIYDSGDNMLMLGDKWLSLSQITRQSHPMQNLVSVEKGYVKSNTLAGNLYLNFNPIKGLVFTSKFGYTVNSTEDTMCEKAYNYGSVAKTIPSLQETISMGYSFQWDNFINYSVSIADKHNISAMAGMSYLYEFENFIETVSKNGFTYNDDSRFYYPQYINVAGGQVTLYGEPVKNSSISYFGRLGYNYDNRYYAQASFRADAFDESYLSASNRWGYFPSVSLGWNITNEPFMAGVSKKTLSLLKLRGSWGINGNVNLLKGLWRYMSTINNSGHYNLNMNGNDNSEEYIAMLENMVNPNLKWETSTQWDLGVDARLFSDRLSATVDYYDRKTDGLLIDNPMPASTGYTSLICNSGIVRNRGFEVELGWRDRAGDFHYSVTANLAHNKNTVEYLDPSVPYVNGAETSTSYATRMSVGEPLWYFYGLNYLGVDPETGKAQYEDVNEDGAIGEDDKMKIGSSNPDFTYGITLSAEWKGIDLTIFGTGSQGNDIWFGVMDYDYQSANLPTSIYNNMWKKAGDNSKYPSYLEITSNDNFLQSSGIVMDGSYFRLAQMQIGYTLPSKIMSKIFVSKLRFYASFDNILTFTKYPGFDPVTATCDYGSGNGIDRATYPSPRRIMLGVNLSF